MLQALHLFKKAEILLETMNKELDKSRVMSNRPPRNGAPLQRTSSVLGMPQTPGPTLVPVSRVRHARYKGIYICTLCAGANLLLVVNPCVFSSAFSAVQVYYPFHFPCHQLAFVSCLMSDRGLMHSNLSMKCMLRLACLMSCISLNLPLSSSFASASTQACSQMEFS